MKLQIGDRVKDKNGKWGIVTGLNAWYVAKGMYESLRKGSSLKNLLNRDDIIERIPRENVRNWWRYL
jgi:hypothetical protein